MKSKFIQIGVCLVLTTSMAMAQSNTDVTIDENGVMRWPDNSEVQGFGVNYTVPFAHAYRSATKLGVSPKEAIDNDVYHFARLGLDAYRVHVWDTEISDTLGNLIVNEHLDAFDYMLQKMKDRGMKFILTPIAFWGNGWPEPAEKTPGFAHKYGKAYCLTNPDAILAQEKYLFQFLNHVNPYTGLAYKDDPDIVAFEVSNEPHHDKSAEQVTAYVKRMLAAMRDTGCNKPIFYNVSHSIHLVDAYYAAGIQGGTFQWYPTGLGAQEELGGNLLPNVDNYNITFKNHEGFKKGAKIVYEFDAADVGRSYIYPAMARSFRTAGIQWATHFSYDPTFLAYANTEYNTHYMNLAYAPKKALSLKLCSEVFHRIPIYKDYGAYPRNASFDDFRVSYEEDLAELVTDQKFIYTNHTSSFPPNQKKLTEIAGFGNSAVVTYEGSGAYFLDKLEDGVWRLEVMPDALWIDNLFGRNSLDKTVAVINHREWPMTIALSDLGKRFSLTGMNEGNAIKSKANNGKFQIQPGVYLISKNERSTQWEHDDVWRNIKIGEYFAPPTTLDDTYVTHVPDVELSTGNDYIIKTRVFTKKLPQRVTVRLPGGPRAKSYEMKHVTGYDYEVSIPKEDIREGFFRYYIVVTENDMKLTFPIREKGDPSNWDFHNRQPYEVKVISPSDPVYLFNAASDIDELERPWNPGVTLIPKSELGRAELRVYIEKLLVREEEGIYDYSMKYHFGKKVNGRLQDAASAKNLVLTGRAMNGTSCPVQLSLITKDGQTFGGLVSVDNVTGEYSVAINDLKPTPLVTLPRPYPGFLPYYFARAEVGGMLDMSQVETLQISLGPGIEKSELDEAHGVAIESVRLE